MYVLIGLYAAHATDNNTNTFFRNHASKGKPLGFQVNKEVRFT